MVIPDGCVGLPTLAALEQGIPVIAVRENRNRMRNELGKLPFGPGKHWGVVVPTTAKQKSHVKRGAKYNGIRPPSTGLGAKQSGINTKAGVALSSVRRPLAETEISRECAKSYTEKGSRVDDTVRI